MTVEKPKPKKKVPKKKRFIAEHKPFVVGGIILGIAIAGIISGIIFFAEEPKGGSCIIGLAAEVENIDPITHSQSTFAEEIIVNQVAESLFDFDYTGKQPRLIFTLAKGYEWNNEVTELTCFLRKGVKFHDGTPFNATAVKWNFDRIHRLVTWWWSYLFELPDGRWIVNVTKVIDEYTVKFVLNEPFVPFLHLLTQATTCILSPTSTPANKTIDLNTEDLVGTGPFTYDEYEPHVNITMSPNQHYWGKKPRIDKLVFKFYEYPTEGEDLWNAIIAKDISILDPYFYIPYPNWSIQTLKNDPGITVRERSPTNYRFIGMNNKLINLTMRKAISYAINYSYMAEDILPHKAVSARSPIPEGILYSDTTSFDVPYYNISLARQILKEAGWPGTSDLTADDDISPGNSWEMLVSNETPLATYTLDYLPGNPLCVGMAFPVPDDLKQIGVKIINQFNWSFPLQLFTLGWIYDYNDPHNAMLDYYSKSEYSFLQINDTLVDRWIEEGVKETDPILREEIYYKIQERLIEQLYPVIFTFSSIEFNIHVKNLRGWQPNPFKTQLKKIYFV